MASRQRLTGSEQEENTDGSTSGTSINRRSWLKLAGVATGGTLLSSVQAAAAASSLPNGVLVDGSGTSGKTTFTFEVSDQVERLYLDDGVDDAINGATVTGSVGDEMAAYAYSGSITSLDVDGPASLVIGSDIENQLPEPRHELVVRTDTEISYEFTTSGKITKLLDNGTDSAEESNDDVVQNSDGTWTATGYCGNGYGDGYAYRGDVLDFKPMTGDYEISLDGELTDAYALTGTEPPSTEPKQDELIIRTDGELSYSFTTTGEITKLLDNGMDSAEESNDDVVQNSDGTWTATGYCGNGYGDGYAFSGDVLSFEPMDGDYEVVLNGDVTDAYALTGTEKSSDDGSSSGNIGGGDGYSGRIYSRSDADAVAESRSELFAALDAANSGDVVFVPSGVTIDLGGNTLRIPDGVTLASDRGVNGNPGARIVEDAEDPGPVVRVNSGTEITGIELRGPHAGREDDWGSGKRVSEGSNATGIWMDNGGHEVHNCAIWGFGYNGLYADGSGIHIHHCEIRETNRWGYGYGVNHGGGADTRINNCYFDKNRHAIAAGGSGGDYEVVNNVFGPNPCNHQVDHHGAAGTRLIVENNTFEGRATDGDNGEAVRFRDGAPDTASISFNWLQAYDGPGDDSTSGGTFYHDDPDNINYNGNAYGSQDPGSDVGATR